MQDVLASVLKKRKDRSLYAILSIKEREVDPNITPELARAFRKVVLDALNDYHELVLDIMASYDQTGEVVLNAEYLRKIDELHAGAVKIPLRGGG